MIAVSFLSGEMDILWLQGLTSLFGTEVINPKTYFHKSIWKRWGGHSVFFTEKSGFVRLVEKKNVCVLSISLTHPAHCVPEFRFFLSQIIAFFLFFCCFSICSLHHGHVMVLKSWVQTVGNSNNMYGYYPLHSALSDSYEKVPTISQLSQQQARTKSTTGNKLWR